MIYNRKIDINKIAKITEIVTEAEKEGDEKAHIILEMAGEELANLAKILITRLKITEPKIHCFGGIFKSTETILKTMRKMIRKEYPKGEVNKSSIRPVAGAVILGLKELQVKIDKEIIENIKIWSRERGYG